MRHIMSIMMTIILTLACLEMAGASKVKRTPYPVITGSEESSARVVYPPYNIPATDGCDLGDTLVLGTSWYESQHNGTIGRMLAKDQYGYLHFCWMNGLNSGASSRHVYYNYIDPAGAMGWLGGTAVESSYKAGYPTLDVLQSGQAVIAFHQVTGSGGDAHAAVAVDFWPYAGAFMVNEAPWINDLEVIWPRMQVSRNDRIRMVATENPANAIAGAPQRHYYTYGDYDSLTYSTSFPEFWQEMTWTQTIAGDVSTSPVSDKLAFAWTYCREEGYPEPPDSAYTQYNNDIWVLIDGDGEDPDFGNAFNLTQFIPPDLQWLPDTLLADQDTMRAYTDLNVFIDQDDWTHVTFTSVAYFSLEGTTRYHASIIWHWSEQWAPLWNEMDDFQVIHNAYDDVDWNFVDCGAWNLKAQRPSLGQDPETGYLYCTYQVYDCDTTALSAGGWPSGEVYVSVSTDGGRNWSVGTNITETVTPENAAPGECLSEISPSMGKMVDDYLHIMYVLDRDAGFVVQDEGTWTLNDIIYHKVPKDDIPTEPLVPQDVYLHLDYVGVKPEAPLQAADFRLDGPYPNPFNPSTVFNLELPAAAEVKLQIFDIGGRAVAEPVFAGSLPAGHHQLTFNSGPLPSGIYLYKLKAGQTAQYGKIVLMK